SSPQGKLLQTFLATAFAALPYRDPAGGWPSDIANVRRKEAQDFFEKYYVPANMNIAIVGVPAQPFAVVGYKRPSYRDPDDSAFDVLSMILSSGRTGLLYQELVQQK